MRTCWGERIPVGLAGRVVGGKGCRMTPVVSTYTAEVLEWPGVRPWVPAEDAKKPVWPPGPTLAFLEAKAVLPTSSVRFSSS